MSPRGVVLMAYGSPQSLEEVPAYLKDIRGGREPTPEGVRSLTERYERIGGRSPLLDITRRQAAVMQSQLGEEWKVEVGMKHSAPWIRDAASALSDCDPIVGLALAPHYAGMSIGGYEKRLRDVVPDATMVHQWYDEPALISWWADSVRAAAAGWDLSEVLVLFTAHSLPSRILDEGDPYLDQLQASSKLVAEAAGASRWEFVFQSAGHSGEPWLGPDICERLASVDARQVVAAPIGFVCDHLEILYDIDVEAQAAARRAGVELRRCALPNDDPRFLRAAVSAVRGVVA